MTVAVLELVDTDLQKKITQLVSVQFNSSVTFPKVKVSWDAKGQSVAQMLMDEQWDLAPHKPFYQ